MVDATVWIRITWEARDNRFILHPTNLDLTFKIIASYVPLEALEWIRGIPGYNPKSSIIGTWNSRLMFLWMFQLVLGENPRHDFQSFTFCPKTWWKSNKIFSITVACWLEVVAKSNRSSAKNRWEICGLAWEAFNGCYSLFDTALEILCPNTSVHKTNRHGDRGSPCRNPLWGWNSFKCFSLHSTVNEVDTMQMTRLVNCVENPLSRSPLVKMSIPHDHMIFSISTLRTILPFWPFLWWTICMSSCAMIILSTACHLDTKCAWCSPMSLSMRWFARTLMT